MISKFSKGTCTNVYISTFESPLGRVTAAADNDFLYMLCFEDSKNYKKMCQIIVDELCCQFVEKKNDLLIRFECELNDYFGGKLKKFTVPIKTFGTGFQKDVWEKLQEIPYASTHIYGDLAKAMGRPASHARAIGAACGANAHVLVIPCHRLVASGSKGGFSCGVNRKEWLLNHEKTHSE